MRVNITNIFITAVTALTALAPLFVSAQVTFPSGIESCARGSGGALSSAVGSYSSSPSPLGGPYVPVADSAVELNTNSVVLNTATLVYKECVLRVIVDKQRQAATAAIVGDTINRFASQRNGGPMFPVFYKGDVLARGDQAFIRDLNDTTLNTIPGPYQGLIKPALAINYSVETRAYNNSVACPNFQGAVPVIAGQDFTFSGFLAARDPRCDPIFDYYFAHDIIERDIALDREEMMYRLMTSNGVYGVESFDADGNRITVMPGSFVQGNVQYALTSGYRQLENANDVGQIVNSTFASMADKAMMNGSGQASNTPTGGLFNLTSAGSGSLNTLQQVLNGALSQLLGTSNASSTEQQYHTIAVNIRTLIQQTTTGIQTAEPKCFAATTTAASSFIQNRPLVEINNQKLSQLISTINSYIQDSENALASGQTKHTQQDVDTVTQLYNALKTVMPTQIVYEAVTFWLTMPDHTSTCSS